MCCVVAIKWWIQGKERQKIAFAIVLWGKPSARANQNLGCPILTFEDVMAKGQEARHSFQAVPAKQNALATLVYTSGTTGQPKVCSLGCMSQGCCA